jgi:uncharacterized membrane protein
MIALRRRAYLLSASRRRAYLRRQRLWTTVLYRWAGRVLSIGFWVSIGLIGSGLLVAAIRDEPIGNEVETLDMVLPDALRLHSQALIDLGILTLLMTPGAVVVLALVISIRGRDRLLTAVAASLVLILVGSVVISLL